MRTVSLMIAALMVLIGVNAYAEVGNEIQAPSANVKTESSSIPNLAELVNQFERGVTTYKNVIDTLGEPKSMPHKEGGFKVISYSDKEAPQVEKKVDDVPVIGVYAKATKSVLKLNKEPIQVTTYKVAFDKNDKFVYAYGSVETYR